LRLLSLVSAAPPSQLAVRRRTWRRESSVEQALIEHAFGALFSLLRRAALIDDVLKSVSRNM
jgi:hypothetical protein